MRIGSSEEPTERTNDGMPGHQPSQPEGEARTQRIPPHMATLLGLAQQATADSAHVNFTAPENALRKLTGGAVRAYQISQRNDLGLKPRDFAIALRERRQPPLTHVGDAVKKGLPSFVALSRGQKFQKLTEAVQEEVQEFGADRSKRERLSEWFSSLTQDERAQITVGPIFEGMASWMQPLAVRVGDDITRMFNAEHLMDLPPDIVAALPPEKREWLDERRDTWQRLGIETGAQAEKFLATHFEHIQITMNEPLPRELERLCELEPAFPEMLLSLQEHGALTYFVKANLTPEPVTDAVRNLAKSQRAFVSHFLRDLIETGKMPALTPKDFADIAEGHMKAHRKAHKRLTEGSIEAHLVDAELMEELESRLDFIGSGRLIQNFSSGVMGMVQVGGGPEQHKALERINNALHEYFGNEWANRRIAIDDSNRVGSSVRETLQTLLWVAPAAEISQRILGLDGLAKFIAGSVDNVIEEFKGSLPTITAAGVPKSEINKRMGAFGLVAAVDALLALKIDDIEREFGPHIAGGAFSLSAVLLPLFTSLYMVFYFAGQYRKLGREGKLPGGNELSDADRQALDRAASKEGLIDNMSTALDKLEASPEVRDAIVAAMTKMDMPLVDANPELNRQNVSRTEARVRGAREVMIVNQAQLAVVIASLTSIATGAAMGRVAIHDGLVEAVLGSAELPFAFGGLQLISRAKEGSFDRYVDNRESLGLLGPDPMQA